MLEASHYRFYFPLQQDFDMPWVFFANNFVHLSDTVVNSSRFFSKRIGPHEIYSSV